MWRASGALKPGVSRISTRVSDAIGMQDLDAPDRASASSVFSVARSSLERRRCAPAARGAVGERDARERIGRVAEVVERRGRRQHAGRRDVGADERVDERALAGVELADDRDAHGARALRPRARRPPRSRSRSWSARACASRRVRSARPVARRADAGIQPRASAASRPRRPTARRARWRCARARRGSPTPRRDRRGAQARGASRVVDERRRRRRGVERARAPARERGVVADRRARASSSGRAADASPPSHRVDERRARLVAPPFGARERRAPPRELCSPFASTTERTRARVASSVGTPRERRRRAPRSRRARRAPSRGASGANAAESPRDRERAPAHERRAPVGGVGARPSRARARALRRRPARSRASARRSATSGVLVVGERARATARRARRRRARDRDRRARGARRAARRCRPRRPRARARTRRARPRAAPAVARGRGRGAPRPRRATARGRRAPRASARARRRDRAASHASARSARPSGESGTRARTRVRRRARAHRRRPRRAPPRPRAVLVGAGEDDLDLADPPADRVREAHGNREGSAGARGDGEVNRQGARVARGGRGARPAGPGRQTRWLAS